MTDERFFEFVYLEYKTDLDLAHTLYQRAGVMLTAIVILAGAAASLGRPDLIEKTLQRLDVLLLQAATLVVACCLICSTYLLFVAAVPRDYPKLTKPFFWDIWRRQYWKQLTEAASDDEERNRRFLAEATREAMLERLLESQGMVAYINQKRQRAFQRAVLFMAAAVTALGVQAASVALLRFQGV